MPTNKIQTDMTRTELDHLEGTIERGKQAFVAVGNALADIRDRRGYRFEYHDFPEYCKLRWEFTYQTAQNYIDGAKVVDALPPEVSRHLDTSKAAALARLNTKVPATKEGGQPREIDQEAIKEVAGAIDLGKATYRQVVKAVDAKLKEKKRQTRKNNLEALADKFEISHTPIESLASVVLGDSQQLSTIVTGAHLIFTSTPYNVGIKYNAHNDTMPADEYEAFIGKVFKECYETLVKGGRIGVVVPYGLGRDPYTPRVPLFMNLLTAAGFTLRGTITWDKMTTGNRTSWGSWDSPSNPALRDRTECIIVAHKISPDLELKGPSLIESPEQFMDLAQDLWQVSPESAERVKHPAPFPEKLVERFIRFYGYKGCKYVDPFAGSGNGVLAAAKLGCEAIGVDIDRTYVGLIAHRIEQELSK